jgi:hypothetical protein
MGGSNANPATLNIQTAGELSGQDGATGTQLFAGSEGKAVVNVNSGGKIQIDEIAVGRFGPGANASQMNVSGGTSLVKANSFVVHKIATLTAADSGHIDVASAVEVNGVADVRGGIMRIGDPSSGPVAPLGAVTVYPNGRLAGSGTIKGNLFANNPFPNLEGVYKPLIALGNSPGLLTVEGNVALDAGTVIELEIGGLAPGTQHDQLAATGSITINGNLEIAVVNSGNGFQLPGIGNPYTVLSAAGGLSGTVQNAASLRSVAGGSLVTWSISAGANNAVLQAMSITPLLDGDFNGDGAVNAADYVVWRESQGGINLAADANRDGAVDQVDLNIWRENFGDPGDGSSAGWTTSVPEPSASWLAFFAIAIHWGRRFRSGI